MTRRPGTAFAAVAGAVAALAIPPTDLYPAILVGLALLAVAIERHRASRPWRGGFGIGVVFGTVGGAVGMRFVPAVIDRFTSLGMAVGLLALVLLALAQSLPWGVGMAFAASLRARRVPLPVSMGIGMLISLSLPAIFFWSPAGLLTPWPIVVQAADILGDRGLSAALAVLAASGAVAAMRYREAPRDRRRWAAPALGLLGGLAVLFAYGATTMPPLEGPEPRLRVGLVHAAVPPKERWDRARWPSILSTLKKQTSVAELSGVDLTIWPEAAFPYPLPHTTTHAARKGPRQLLGGGLKGPILFGFIALDEPQRTANGWVHDRFNSATIVGRDHALQPSYDKMRLLWFGETVPLGDQIPWLRRTFQRSGGLIPGDAIRPLVLARDEGEPVRLAVLNCYEDTIPGYAREVTRAISPDLLVNVTNDAWFRGSAEPMLHQRLAALRAIETRRDMVRAVNLGITGWIDAGGRIRAARADEEPYALLVEPALRRTPPTWYLRFGDATAWLILVGALLGHIIQTRRHRSSA